MAEEMHYPEDEEGIEVKGKPTTEEVICSGDYIYWGTFPPTCDLKTGYWSFKLI